MPVVLQYFSNDIVAAAVTIGGVFLGTLLIVSIITIKISDMILDSRVGALDRTLGFLFGLGARAGHRGGRLPVLRLAGAGPTASPNGSRTPSRCVVLQGTGRMADVDVAGRPRKHHFEAVEAQQAEDQEQQEAPTGGRSSLGPPAGPLCLLPSRNRLTPAGARKAR